MLFNDYNPLLILWINPRVLCTFIYIYIHRYGSFGDAPPPSNNPNHPTNNLSPNGSDHDSDDDHNHPDYNENDSLLTAADREQHSQFNSSRPSAVVKRDERSDRSGVDKNNNNNNDNKNKNNEDDQEQSTRTAILTSPSSLSLSLSAGQGVGVSHVISALDSSHYLTGVISYTHIYTELGISGYQGGY